MTDLFKVKDKLDGLFLVFLSIMGSFTFKLLGCPLQIFLANNIVARHVVYLSIVLFTTSFLTDGKENPLYHFLYALCIYLFIVTFTKMTVVFTTAIFALLIILYISHLYIKYYSYQIDNKTNNNDNAKYKTYVSNLEQANNIIIVSILIITVLGFVKFAIHKKGQHGKKFNLIKFIFGVRLCKYD